jgi:ribosome-associated heat shock protein Hsp15
MRIERRWQSPRPWSKLVPGEATSGSGGRMRATHGGETGTSERVDVWLWAARLFKTRALAKTAIALGRVEHNGHQADKPSRTVHPGDTLAVLRGDERLELTVRAVSDRRGPAAVAQALYAESDEARSRRLAERARRSAERAGFQAPAGKPNKRARRLILALGDIDAL